MTSYCRRAIQTLSFLVMLCLPATLAAQADGLVTDTVGHTLKASDQLPMKPQRDNRLVQSDTLPSLTPREARAITLSDSLHRAANAELGILKPSETSELSENADSESADTTQAAKAPSRRELRKQKIATFTPDPDKATWAGIVFPGGGQIYNHKYWKLPIVYGGFLGCAYALNWNNQMYSDYSQAYLDIMDDDPGTASYEDFLPPRYNVEANRDYLERVFKNRKDNYRRQRDLSIFCFIGVYLISVIDAYVDAELSNFDISEDLTVQVRPSIIDHQRHATPRNTQSYGLQCSFSF